ncbi:MAG: RNA methyltransferase, partial [Terriglobales bacterium]
QFGKHAVKPHSNHTRRHAPLDRLHVVSGRHNARLKELRLAFRRAELTERGECAIEGVKLLEEALRNGQHLESVFFSEVARPLAEKLMSQIGARTEALILPATLFNSIVPSEAPQGVAALLKLRKFSTNELLDRATEGPLLAAAGLQDPGNLGTILRSAEAFGAAGVFLLEGTVSPYNWKVLRGSAGSIFRQPFVQISSVELIPLLRNRGVRLLATSSHQGTPLAEANWRLPLAIFIGNEGAGLALEIVHQMDETLVIPQSGTVESLNAGVAASIVLYEAAKKSEVRS